MARLRLVALAASVLALASLIASSSTQQALAVGSQIRTFVASTGSDANPCSRVAPCRTFGAALAQTASGGEIVALDSGGYGAVTISQAVTIVAAPGVQASISPSSGAAITVNAAPSDAVVLRNLYLNAQGGNFGIYYQSGGALYVDGLTINGFTDIGISMVVSTAADLYVTDTVVRNTGGTGIYLVSATTYAEATIVRTRLENNNYGISAASNARAHVKDSVASGHGAVAFSANSFSTLVEINLEGCVATHNLSAIAAASVSGTAIIRVSNCTVTGNSIGLSAGTNGSILSRSNNTVEGNMANGTFSGTYAAK